jgi:hypothetical protein
VSAGSIFTAFAEVKETLVDLVRESSILWDPADDKYKKNRLRSGTASQRRWNEPATST